MAPQYHTPADQNSHYISSRSYKCVTQKLKPVIIQGEIRKEKKMVVSSVNHYVSMYREPGESWMTLSVITWHVPANDPLLFADGSVGVGEGGGDECVCVCERESESESERGRGRGREQE